MGVIKSTVQTNAPCRAKNAQGAAGLLLVFVGLYQPKKLVICPYRTMSIPIGVMNL